MPTKKVIEMTARSSSSLAFDDYVYLTGESPYIDEKMQASVMRDYVLSGVKTSANSGLAQTSTSYAAANPDYELSLDANNLTTLVATANSADIVPLYTAGSEPGSPTTKNITVANLVAAATSAVTAVTGGPGTTVTPTTGAPKVSSDLTTNGGLEFHAAGDAGTLQIAQGISEHDVAQFTSGVVDNDFLRVDGTTVEGRSASEVLSDIGAQAALNFGISSGDVTKCGSGIVDDDFIRIDGTTTEGRSAAEVLTDIAASPVAGSSSITTVGTVTSGTWSTGAVIADVTMTLGSDAEGDMYYRDAAGKLKIVGIGSAGDHLEVVAGVPDWQAAGHGAGTVYSVASGSGLTGGTITGAGTLSVELTTNGGLEPSAGGVNGTLQVAQGISQYDVAQFTTSVVDDDFLRIDGTTVEGRSASEVLSDIGAQAALTAGDGLDLTVTTLSVDLADTATFTSANTVSKAVVRDGSGDFAAGTVTADLTGDVTGESILLDGNKNITPGDGSMIHVDTATLTDNVTAISGTATKFTSNSFEGQTLAATNASVTTTDAATVYISGPTIAGTNETLTRTHALWVDSGNARFDGSIYSGTTEAINSSGLVTVTNQSNIAGVGTITSGTWNGTVIGDTYISSAATWNAKQDAITDGAGLDFTGATLAVEKTTNGGIEFSGAGDSGTLQVAQGISQYDVAQFAASVADDDFLRIDGTAVEGRSASEVLTDIGASPVAGSSSIVTVGTLSSGTIEGLSVLSTGEPITKFLRADSDGTSSWQPVPAAGVTAGFSIAMAVAL